MPGTVTLAFEAGGTLLALDGDQPLRARLPVGRDDIERAFRHHQPGAAEIELGIDLVEEEVGRLDRRIASLPLRSADATVARLATAAGLDGSSGEVILTVAAVENLFTRMAARAAGSLPAADRLPDDATFAATLLVLRELMHHLQFASVAVAPPPGRGGHGT